MTGFELLNTGFIEGLDGAAQFVRLLVQADALLDNGGNGQAGAVSHLMAATLQTLGVYAQAEILKTFGPTLTKLAALCYLASLVGAIMSTAIFGTYRRASYFLIGPTLFYFVISKTPISGTQLKMGSVARGSVEDRKQFIEKFVVPGTLSDTAEVSYIFLGVDAVTSSIVQGIVDVLVDAENKEDLLFKARERVLSWVYMAAPDNPGLVKLVSAGYMAECAEIMNMLTAIRKEKLDPTSRSLENDNLTQVGIDLKQRYEQLKSLRRLVLDPEVQTYLRENPQIQSQYYEDKVSCADIWEYLRITAREIAAGQLSIESFLQRGPRDQDVPWTEVEQEVRNAISDAANRDGVQPEDVLAAYIIRNVLSRTPHQMMTQAVFDKAPFNAERRSGTLEDIAGTESYGGYLRIVYFAATIPYIQGLLLYMLAAAFPFFAVFLVMPGRAYTFLVWVSLWVWVKSWDVGFAMVHVARQVLWQFVRHSPNGYSQVIDWQRPETVLQLIADNDPLATLNTYFTVVGLLTVSVPLLTAHATLGATNLYSAFRMSIDGTATRFGQYRAMGTRRELASKADENMQRRQQAAGLKAAIEAGDAVQAGELFTPDGQNLGNRADNSIAATMSWSYQKGVMDYHWSKEGMANAAWLAAVERRPTSRSYGMGQQYLAAFTGMLEQTFRGVEAGRGHTGFGASGNAPQYTRPQAPSGIGSGYSPDGGGD